jgi:hypothetical protein
LAPRLDPRVPLGTTDSGFPSIKEFQLPQSGQRPSHFAEEYPHDWHSKTEGFFDIGFSDSCEFITYFRSSTVHFADQMPGSQKNRHEFHEFHKFQLNRDGGIRGDAYNPPAKAAAGCRTP